MWMFNLQGYPMLPPKSSSMDDHDLAVWYMVTTGVPPRLANISMDQDEGPGEYQPIPLDKIEDFGVHCKQHLGRNLGYTQVMPLPSCDLVILEIY